MIIACVVTKLGVRKVKTNKKKTFAKHDNMMTALRMYVPCKKCVSVVPKTKEFNHKMRSLAFSAYIRLVVHVSTRSRRSVWTEDTFSYHGIGVLYSSWALALQTCYQSFMSCWCRHFLRIVAIRPDRTSQIVSISYTWRQHSYLHFINLPWLHGVRRGAVTSGLL